MYKLEYITESPKFKYIDSPGNYNHLPAPYKEVSFSEFINHYTVYFSEYRSTCQLFDYGELNGSYNLYFYSDRAYAVRWDTKDPLKSKVLRIGCDHDWKVIKQERCYVESKCTKCGVVRAIDSSD